MRNDVEGARYLPEGLPAYGMQVEPALAPESLQAIAIPTDSELEQSEQRLILEATGNGPYTVQMFHVNEEGLLPHEPVSGSVRMGDAVELATSDFRPVSTGRIPYEPISFERRPVYVVEVAANSEASRSGFLPGDIIESINGEAFASPDHVARFIAGLRTGAEIDFRIRRGNSQSAIRTVKPDGGLGLKITPGRPSDAGPTPVAPDSSQHLPSPESIDWDHPLSARVFELSCNSGTYWDCARLAAKLRQGRGIPEDLPRSAALFERACNGGLTQACGNLGYHYVEGKGVARDASRGAELYRRACDADEFYFCQSLARLYAEGDGVRKSIERAAELFRKACVGGEEAACEISQPYYAAAATLRNLKRASLKEFRKLAGLSDGDRVDKVYKIFGDPDHVEQEELDGGHLGMRLMCLTPEQNDFWVVYDLDSKRIEIIGYMCSALPWLEARVRDEKMSLMCAHESVVLTKWGAPDRNREENRVYRIPGAKGAVRFSCRDKDLNVCDLIQVEWWRD